MGTYVVQICSESSLTHPEEIILQIWFLGARVCLGHWVKGDGGKPLSKNQYSSIFVKESY